MVQASVYEALSYYGEIRSITAKTVTIAKGHRDGVARLDVGAFASRNRDFDLTRAQKRNSEWMD